MIIYDSQKSKTNSLKYVNFRINVYDVKTRDIQKCIVTALLDVSDAMEIIFL